MSGVDEKVKNQSGQLLRNAVGIPALVYFVLSAIAPLSSVIGYIPLVFGLGNGVGAAGAFLLAAIVWMIFAVGYTRMSRHIRNAGAFYAYVSRGLGRTVGITAAYLALAAYSALIIAVYGLLGYGVKAFIEPRIHINEPWWLYSLAAAVIIFLLAYRQVTVTARVVAILGTAEILLITIVSLAILFAHRPAGLSATPFEPSHVFSGSSGIALMFAFGVFIGFESTVVYSEEARNPRRTIPVATYVATALIGLLFALSTYAITVGWGNSGVVTQVTHIFTTGGDPSTLTTDLARETLGSWSVYAIQFLFVSSVAAFLIAFHNIIARYMFSLGRSGLLPRTLGRTHNRHHSPHVASAAQTIFSIVVLAITALLGWDPYLQVSAWMAALGVLAFLVLYVLTALSVVGFFARLPEERTLWATVFSPLIAAGVVLWIVYLTIRNFDQYVGAANHVVGLVLQIFIAATIGVGLIAARCLARYRPTVFAEAGLNPEETPEQPIRAAVLD